jgi:enamine deaminase RidA (YjgF/YER057c/UK114 family)
MSNTIDERLAALGITLPTAAGPAANYVPFVIEDGLLTISGQIPVIDAVVAVTGRLGAEVSLAEGQRAAGICALNILAQAKAALGDLSHIRRCIRLGGFVASTQDFTDQHKVINGASDMIVRILGESGKHARAAVGVVSLPLNAAVEVEALFVID